MFFTYNERQYPVSCEVLGCFHNNSKKKKKTPEKIAHIPPNTSIWDLIFNDVFTDTFPLWMRPCAYFDRRAI